MSSLKMKRFEPYNLIRSFANALSGILYALTRERNLRIHLAAGAFALFLTRYYPLSNAELGLLVLCVGFVPACELINTAIEKTVDIEMPSFHHLAKIAKDVAAGAVLLAAVTSVAVGFLLFWDIPTLKLIGYDIMTHPLPWGIAVSAAVLWIVLPQNISFDRGGT